MTEAVVTAEFVRLFDACTGLQLDARDTLLQTECSEHPEMRLLIERVLNTSAPIEHDTLLRDGGLMKWTEQLLAEDQEHPDQIGRYRVLSTLSRGGMGTVLLAVRSDLQNTGLVAIKVINRGLDRGAFLTIFDREREILASLKSHPNIVHLEDADVTRTGAPYLVMEYIDGLPLNEYCEKNELTVPDRLGLFITVCEAVSFAHQRAIIHRDLKPNNVLITTSGSPKLLDFGIAKLLATTEREASVSIVEQKRIMTIEYASPEQVRGELLDVRTDVYSLGVVLYRMLTGVLPYDLNLESTVLRERAVCDEEPKLASLAVQGRGDSVKDLQRQLTGDLDNILSKTLRKRADERYASVEQFSEDIRRHLRNEPVRARPNTWAYSTGRFIRRHRLPVLTAASFIVLLLVAFSLVLWQARLASKEAATTKAVSEFLENDLLAQASANNQSGPSAKPDPDLKVRTALDRAATRIDGKFERQPELEAEIRRTVGTTYKDLGLYPQARDQQQRALELYRRTLGDKNKKTLEAIEDLGLTFALEGDYLQAESLANEALGIARRILGPDDPGTASCMNNLAKVYYCQGKFAQSEALEDQALKIRRRALGPEDPNTLGVMNNLAGNYAVQGKYAQAEAQFNQLLKVERRVLGPEHPRTLESIFNLGCVYEAIGKKAQAVALFNQLVDVERRVLGPEHPDTLRSMSQLASNYSEEGSYAQAEALYRQVVDIQRRILGAEHPDTLRSMGNLAANYIDEGKYTQAETLGRQVLDAQQRILGTEHYATLITMGNLAETYGLEGRYTQAEALYGQALEIERRVLGLEHATTLMTMNNLSDVYDEEGKYTKAEALSSQVVASYRRSFGPEHRDTLRSMGGLAATYGFEGKYALAEALFSQTLEIERRVLGPEGDLTLNALSDEASMFEAAGKYSLAETYAAQALAGQRRTLGPDHPLTMASANDLALAWLSQGKFAESETLARETGKMEQAKHLDDWQRFRAESLLGASLAGQKKYAEAEPLLLAGYQGMAARKERIAAPDQYHLERARLWIVQLYLDWGKPEKAAEWRKAHTDL